VIGYGLDAAQRYRNLGFIARYEPDSTPAGTLGRRIDSV
jgi:hypothetical protein